MINMSIETRLKRIAEKDGTKFLLNDAIKEAHQLYSKEQANNGYKQPYAVTLVNIYEYKKSQYKCWCESKYMTKNKGW